MTANEVLESMTANEVLGVLATRIRAEMRDDAPSLHPGLTRAAALIVEIQAKEEDQPKQEIEMPSTDRAKHIGMAAVLAEASRALSRAEWNDIGRQRPGRDLMDRIEAALHGAVGHTFEVQGDEDRGYHFDITDEALSRMYQESGRRPSSGSGSTMTP